MDSSSSLHSLLDKLNELRPILTSGKIEEEHWIFLADCLEKVRDIDNGEELINKTIGECGQNLIRQIAPGRTVDLFFAALNADKTETFFTEHHEQLFSKMLSISDVLTVNQRKTLAPVLQLPDFRSRCNSALELCRRFAASDFCNSKMTVPKDNDYLFEIMPEVHFTSAAQYDRLLDIYNKGIILEYCGCGCNKVRECEENKLSVRRLRYIERKIGEYYSNGDPTQDDDRKFVDLVMRSAKQSLEEYWTNEVLTKTMITALEAQRTTPCSLADHGLASAATFFPDFFGNVCKLLKGCQFSVAYSRRIPRRPKHNFESYFVPLYDCAPNAGQKKQQLARKPGNLYVLQEETNSF